MYYSHYLELTRKLLGSLFSIAIPTRWKAVCHCPPSLLSVGNPDLLAPKDTMRPPLSITTTISFLQSHQSTNCFPISPMNADNMSDVSLSYVSAVNEEIMVLKQLKYFFHGLRHFNTCQSIVTLFQCANLSCNIVVPFHERTAKHPHLCPPFGFAEQRAQIIAQGYDVTLKR